MFPWLFIFINRMPDGLCLSIEQLICQSRFEMINLKGQSLSNYSFMNQKFHFTFIALSLVLLSACKAAGTSMIVGSDYDESKNQTTLTLLPYGGFVIPDKWTKTSYNEVSKQHYFHNTDSTTIALAKNPKEKYPFYKSGQSDKDFLTAFTSWESEHFKTQGAIITIIDDQPDKGYILWSAAVPAEGVSTIYLYGLKSKYAYNLSAYSKTWSNEKMQDFLVKLFDNN